MKKLRVMVIQVLFLYMNSVIKPIFVCVVIGLFVELINYVGTKNTPLQQKSRLVLSNFNNQLQSCYTVLNPELH